MWLLSKNKMLFISLQLAVLSNNPIGLLVHVHCTNYSVTSTSRLKLCWIFGNDISYDTPILLKLLISRLITGAKCANLLLAVGMAKKRVTINSCYQLVVSRCQKTTAKLMLSATTNTRNFCRLYQSCNVQSTTWLIIDANYWIQRVSTIGGDMYSVVKSGQYF